ncbi:MAG: acetylglutamate kinase [Deltaproteobacteria bacterium]|nr:acetylglutamate kinase [Deltaproteobacteria bacterium]
MKPVIVIKVGGEVVAGTEVGVLAGEVRALSETFFDVAVVHGGGPQATELQSRLGIKTRQVAGRRITDAATLDVMKMAVAGKVNVELCAALGAAGVRAVGLHGASALAVHAKKRPPRVVTGGGPDPIDFGFVGDVAGFNLELLSTLWGAGYTPVVACLGADDTGATYNINADIVANQLAATLKAAHLFLVTGSPGVLRDVDDVTSRIPKLTVDEARRAIAAGQITGGMIPKIEEAIAVINAGVGTIHILGNLAPGDLARAVGTRGSVGTALVA